MTSNESEFQLAIHNALCSCLGLSPSSEQALSLIRQAYTEPENNPQPARTADVIYWSLSPESAEDPEPGLREVGKGKRKVRHDIRNLNGRDSPPGRSLPFG